MIDFVNKVDSSRKKYKGMKPMKYSKMGYQKLKSVVWMWLGYFILVTVVLTIIK